MPRKIKLSDKLRKFFNFGGSQRGGGMDELHTPSTGTYNGDSEPSGSTASSYHASPARPYQSPAKPVSQAGVHAPHHAHIQPPLRRAISNHVVERPYAPESVGAPEPPVAPADSNESGSTNPTRSVPVQQAISQLQHGSSEQRRMQLEEYAHLLRHGTDDQKTRAAEFLFQYSSEGDRAKEDLAGLRVVQPLVDLLSSGNRQGRYYATHTLSCLISSNTLRLEMQQCDAIPALVTLLQESRSLDVRRGTLRALHKFARADDAACSIIVAAGGLQPLVSVLASSDDGVVRRALIALYFIGADKPDLQLAIAHAGAIPKLLALCKAESVDVQGEAVDVIKMLARQPHCAQLIVDGGGLEVLGQLAMGGNAKTSQSATRALQRLAELPQLRGVVRPRDRGPAAPAPEQDEADVQQLVDTIVRGDQRWVRETAVQHLETVAIADPTMSREMVDCGMIENLVSLLERGDVQERLTAARAMANMANQPYVRERIVAAGAVPLLVKDIGAATGPLREVSLTALEKLLEEVEAAKAAAEGHCVQAVLYVLTTSQDAALQYLCLRVLYHTCHSQGLAKGHLLDNGGVELLVRFCWQGSGELQCMAAAILQDLAAHPSTHQQLIADGAVVALTALGTSKSRSVVDASASAQDSLLAAAEPQVQQFAQAEEQLQQQVSGMLDRVRDKVELGAALEQAFRLVPRGSFVPAEQATQSTTYTDRSIVVAHLGISMIAPHLETLALEHLQLAPGHSFLEAGSGSGFTTCLAAVLVGATGHALGVEIDGIVHEHARRCAAEVVSARPLQHCGHPEYLNMDILGLLPGAERWDRILVSMTCPKEVVQALVGLLKPGGRLVAPCDGDLLLIHEASGLAGQQVLARNVPYRSMAMPYAQPPAHHAPLPQHPHATAAAAHANARGQQHSASSDHSSGGNTSSSPNVSVDNVRASSTPSESSSHAAAEDGGDPHDPHHPDYANGHATPAAGRPSLRQPESRIPTPQAKQRPTEQPPVSPTPSARAAARRPNAAEQRLQRAGSAGAGAIAGARARSPRAAAAAAGPGHRQQLVDRQDSHLGASPSGMDPGGRGQAGGVRQPNAVRRHSQEAAQPNGVAVKKVPAVANGHHDAGPGKPPLDPSSADQLPNIGQGVNLMKWNDIEICRNAEGKKCRLGEGGFGVVYRALMNNVDEIAVKVVKNDNPTPKERDVFIKEVSILSRLHHRNIVQFYGACLQPGANMFIVTELMKGGDLYTALRNHPETMRWEHLGKKVALDVALGINYLHSQRPPMMHRDLKSPNVLLSEEGVAKIADVGMVRTQVKDLVTAQPVMTPLWAAPEVMRHERASIKADIWSYGILIWELVSGEDITDYQPLAMSMQMGAKAGDGKIMRLPPKCPIVAQKLFNACCQADADARPTAQQLVEWLRNDTG